LNLAMRTGEQAASLAENWRRVAQRLCEAGPPVEERAIALLSQVHGKHVIEVDEPAGPLATLGEADAMWTSKVGVILGIRVADCAPVLVASPGGVAAIHAGWRGAAAGVVDAAIAALSAGTGDGPDQMIASVGPCISVDRFEVGQEVVDAFAAVGITGVSRMGDRGRPHLDLRRAVELQLRRAGVAHVEHADLCTASDDRFWSHRRDGEPSGRTAGVIARVRS
jgi:YfiH family protein